MNIPWYLGIISGPKISGSVTPPECVAPFSILNNDLMNVANYNPIANEVWVTGKQIPTIADGIMFYRYDSDTLALKGTVTKNVPDLAGTSGDRVLSIITENTFVFDSVNSVAYTVAGVGADTSKQWVIKFNATTGAVIKAAKPVGAGLGQLSAGWMVSVNPLNGDVWLYMDASTTGSYVVKLDPTTLQPVSTTQLHATVGFRNMTMDASGNLWFTASTNVYKFDTSTLTPSNVLTTTSIQWPLYNKATNMMYLMPVVSTNGIKEFNPATGALTGKTLSWPAGGVGAPYQWAIDTVNNAMWYQDSTGPSTILRAFKLSDGTAFGFVEPYWDVPFKTIQEWFIGPISGEKNTLYFQDRQSDSSIRLNRFDICNMFAPGEVPPPMPAQDYGNVSDTNLDDDFAATTPSAFSFKFFGDDLNSVTSYVGSNSYWTVGTGVSAYQYSSQASPAFWTGEGTPALVMGSNDRSVQRVFSGMMPDGTYKIRYEGHYTYSGGVAGTPTIWWELVFKDDHTFTVFSDCENNASIIQTFYQVGQQVWGVASGTSAATSFHTYNGANDADFVIPMTKGQTYKFTAANAEGTLWSMALV